MNVTFPAKVDITADAAVIQAKFTVNRADWGIKLVLLNLIQAEWMIK